MALFRFFLVVSSLVLLLVTSACGRRAGRTVPLTPSTSLVSQGGGTPYVRAAIVTALRERRYRVESESGNQIIAVYERGRHTLRVAVVYDERSFVITHVDSVGLDHFQTVRGTEVIGPHYARYVTQLDRQIQDELARPQREATARADAAAVAARRPQSVIVVSGGAPTAYGYVTCEDLVTGYGHRTGQIHCSADTDLTCADTLLSMGRPTTELMFCRNVEPGCARQHLLSGGMPTALMRCRY